MHATYYVIMWPIVYINYKEDTNEKEKNSNLSRRSHGAG